ncbi:hypothetical protein J3D60_001111 [Pseudomonas sp. S3E17]|nr:hypothetical protein [Pseudomonas sp. S3E17]
MKTVHTNAPHVSVNAQSDLIETMKRFCKDDFASLYCDVYMSALSALNKQHLQRCLARLVRSL